MVGANEDLKNISGLLTSTKILARLGFIELFAHAETRAHDTLTTQSSGRPAKSYDRLETDPMGTLSHQARRLTSFVPYPSRWISTRYSGLY
jgi:hypothetical protein